MDEEGENSSRQSGMANAGIIACFLFVRMARTAGDGAKDANEWWRSTNRCFRMDADGSGMSDLRGYRVDGTRLRSTGRMRDDIDRPAGDDEVSHGLRSAHGDAPSSG